MQRKKISLLFCNCRKKVNRLIIQDTIKHDKHVELVRQISIPKKKLNTWFNVNDFTPKVAWIFLINCFILCFFFLQIKCKQTVMIGDERCRFRRAVPLIFFFHFCIKFSAKFELQEQHLLRNERPFSFHDLSSFKETKKNSCVLSERTLRAELHHEIC